MGGGERAGDAAQGVKCGCAVSFKSTKFIEVCEGSPTRAQRALAPRTDAHGPLTGLTGLTGSAGARPCSPVDVRVEATASGGKRHGPFVLSRGHRHEHVGGVWLQDDDQTDRTTEKPVKDALNNKDIKGV